MQSTTASTYQFLASEDVQVEWVSHPKPEINVASTQKPKNSHQNLKFKIQDSKFERGRISSSPN